jgi:hypothetical protein
MRKGFKAGIAIFGLSVCATAAAEYVGLDVGMVTRMRTYTSIGNGDVVLWVQNLPPGCDGFWFRTTEPNGKEMFAQVLAAQKTQSSLYFTGHTDNVWPGSNSIFCKIYSIDTFPN